MIEGMSAGEFAGYTIVIRPDSRLWAFRLSGGMSVSTFKRTLAPAQETKPDA